MPTNVIKSIKVNFNANADNIACLSVKNIKIVPWDLAASGKPKFRIEKTN